MTPLSVLGLTYVYLSLSPFLSLSFSDCIELDFNGCGRKNVFIRRLTHSLSYHFSGDAIAPKFVLLLSKLHEFNFVDI